MAGVRVDGCRTGSATPYLPGSFFARQGPSPSLRSGGQPRCPVLGLDSGLWIPDSASASEPSLTDGWGLRIIPQALRIDAWCTPNESLVGSLCASIDSVE